MEKIIGLSDEQKKIVNSNAEKVVVLSAAASGKTHTFVEKIRAVLKKGVDPNKIVCLTFTNNAAEEIRIRLGEDYKEGIFVGTIHSYANYLLMSAGVNTVLALGNGDFDSLFDLIEDNMHAIQSVDFLALDEAQDSSQMQFDFLLNMVRPNTFLFVGDVRQSIYGFNGARPDIILDLIDNEEIVSYEMRDNHRNSREIVTYANWIANKMKDVPNKEVMPRRGSYGQVENIKESQIMGILTKEYENVDWSKWVILCRTNARVNHFMAQLTRLGIPNTTFKLADGNLKDIDEKRKHNSVKVLTIHSSKGLEWDNVIVADQSWRKGEDLNLMYVAATRARNKLYMSKKR